MIRLVRHAATKPDERQWNPAQPDPDLLTGVDAVIHLAGASIAGRFTESHRAAIRDSRIGPTRRLAELIAKSADGPKVLICASAIGYYGYDRGEESLTEDSERGDGFLADVVDEWEHAATVAEDGRGPGGPGAHRDRAVPERRDPSPAAAAVLAPGSAVASATVTSGCPTSGSTISSTSITAGCGTPTLSGPVNAVAVDPVRNIDYTRTLANVLRRPAVLPVPPFGPRLLLGEQGARELACANQRVLPARLQQAGHRFRHPGLDQTLRHLLGR